METQLGHEIKHFRRIHGYPLDVFSERIGCSKSYLSMIERGEDPRGNVPRPSFEIMTKLSEILHKPLSELLEMSDTPYFDKNEKLKELKQYNVEDYASVLNEIIEMLQSQTRTKSSDSKRQKEIDSINSVLRNLSLEDLQKYRQVTDILFNKSASLKPIETPDSSKSTPVNSNLKIEHAEKLFGSDSTCMAFIKRLQKDNSEEFDDVLNSCESVWRIKNEKSEALRSNYDKMVQSLKEEILRKAVLYLTQKNGK